MDKGKEAIRRMQMLELCDEAEESIIKALKNRGKVYKSIPSFSNRAGIIYTLTPGEKAMVDEFKERTGCLPYHVIRNVTDIGVMYSILYVSKVEEEWEEEKEAIKSIQNNVAYPIAYVYNAGNAEPDDDDLSGGFGEFKAIGITKGCGGLCRVV